MPKCNNIAVCSTCETEMVKKSLFKNLNKAIS